MADLLFVVVHSPEPLLTHSGASIRFTNETSVLLEA